MSAYSKNTDQLETIIDFIRFALSEAALANLYFGHGTNNLKDDMLNLVLGTLHLPLDIDLYLLQGRLTPQEKEQILTHLDLRIRKRLPVPYITKEAYFAGLPFYVDERVLIPRSPLFELIHKQFNPWIDPETVHSILDMCTGSGCIAIACQYAFPLAQVDALDISADALAVAAINKEKLHTPEVRLIQSDVWQKLPQHPYDIIIANPPYVSALEMETLPEEYRHEPRLALEAEENGLKIVHQILAQAKNYLNENGILLVEVGNSEEAVRNAYPDLPFTWLEFEHGGQGVFLLTAEQLP